MEFERRRRNRISLILFLFKASFAVVIAALAATAVSIIMNVMKTPVSPGPARPAIRGERTLRGDKPPNGELASKEMDDLPWIVQSKEMDDEEAGVNPIGRDPDDAPPEPPPPRLSPEAGFGYGERPPRRVTSRTARASGGGGVAESPGKSLAAAEAGPPRPPTNGTGYPTGPNDVHVVFSTDCRSYQLWQAVVLFHSASVAGHDGPVTQLVSGCGGAERAELTRRHALWAGRRPWYQHFTPDYAYRDNATGVEYPYLNKPNALLHWLEAQQAAGDDTGADAGMPPSAAAAAASPADPLPPPLERTVLALVDPDFVFLRPLTTYLDPHEVVAAGDGVSLEGMGLEHGGWVREGVPVGQRFGLPSWTKFDLARICPADSPCRKLDAAEARRSYDLIPPYVAHVNDWRRLARVWVEQAPRVYEQYPSLLAEQTAYATAAASLGLRHLRINNLAVENEKVEYESWHDVDSVIPNACAVELSELQRYLQLPVFLHYTHMYRVGEWLFSKRRFRRDEGYDQLQCGAPLLADPPLNLQDQTYKKHPDGRQEPIGRKTARRNAFMLCVMTKFVNAALKSYKAAICSPSGGGAAAGPADAGAGATNLDHSYRIT